jgi:hypothetical protein
MECCHIFFMAVFSYSTRPTFGNTSNTNRKKCEVEDKTFQDTPDEREREMETKRITKPECHSSHLPEVGDP